MDELVNWFLFRVFMYCWMFDDESLLKNWIMIEKYFLFNLVLEMRMFLLVKIISLGL